MKSTLLALVLVILSFQLCSAGERWALLIGCDTYENRQITPLNYAVRDVTALSKVLVDTGVPQKNIFLLTDQGRARNLATGTNIIWRLEWLAKRLQPGDTLYFYFSGHGLEKDGDTYLLSYDSDIGSNITLKRTAVRMSELKDITKSVQASNIISFMDACRNDPQSGKSVNAPNPLTNRMAKDLVLVNTSPTENKKRLMVTFFSCSAGERSWESEETSHGFFSYHVMRGLMGAAADSKGTVTVNSLESYLAKEVPDSVDRALGEKQTPWTIREGTSGGGVVLASNRTGAVSTVPVAQPAPVSSTQPSAPSSSSVRESTLNELRSLGFVVSPTLPKSGTSQRRLRPQHEIESRLTALRTYVIWVAGPPGYDLDALRRRATSGPDAKWLTTKERAVFEYSQPEAKELYLDAIGWQMENMWALAWVLGFDSEPPLQGQIAGELARKLVFDYSAPETPKRLRPLERVVEIEDLFYCAHNAVRSAQAGQSPLPAGLDPLADGGGIHERRHALTWCLSPGVSWEDTDLST